MKFTCAVEIDLPVETVFELIEDRENYHKWQPNLLSQEPISGTPGEQGAKTKMRYRSGKHEFDLFETITVRDAPRELTGEYLTEGTCWNVMKRTFTPITENRTRYEAEITYKFLGIMIKLMALVMPRVFKKQVEIQLKEFKAYAEATARAN